MRAASAKSDNDPSEPALWTTQLPWHQSAWRTALSSRRPSAWLLEGPAGLGKRQFAATLVAHYLCEGRGHRHAEHPSEANPSDPLSLACGVCSPCRWLAQGQHPDLRVLGEALPGIPHPEAEGSASATEDAASPDAETSPGDLGIDAVRALSDFVNLGSHRDGLRIAVLSRADRMTLPAANALLKTLEEPPLDFLFILCADRLANLPATVVSRCRRLTLARPTAEQAQGWLQQQLHDGALARRCLAATGGSPLQALDLAQSGDTTIWQLLDAFASPQAPSWPADTAEKWHKLSFERVLDTLQRWCLDVALAKATGQVRYFPERLKFAQALADNTHSRALAAFHAELSERRASAKHPLNAKLRLETLLMSYQKTVVSVG